MIDQQTVDRIYAAANIVEVIGDYVTLKRKGVNYTACCPFHNEKTPSFIVSPAKGFYKCFGCGKGGNAVTFVMDHEGLSYPEALKLVAKRYGIEIQEREQTPEDIARNNDRESMFALNSWAADYFTHYLHHADEGMAVGMSYFRQKRKLTDATIEKFGLGFCPSKGDKMSQDALAAGYKQEFLTRTGLSLERESDRSLYDRFRDRVIFPVYNISGRVVAFGGRTLRTDGKVAKYQNSPESEIYSKSRELYGLYHSKKAIQQLDCAIMVEGYLDVISMHQAGVENVVASSGTALTEDQIRLLKRFTRNVTLIYDSDPAGVKASLRGVNMLLKEGLSVRVVTLPEGDDPDTFAQARTAEQVLEYIRQNERDFLDFKAHLLLNEAQGDPIRKSRLINDMVESIALIPDQIQRSVFIKECSRTMDIDEQVLIDSVAHKRISSTGDPQADAFVRRQMQQRQAEQRDLPPMPVEEGTVDPGSSLDVLEYEMVEYLLRYGHRDFEVREEREFVTFNVAEYIFGALDEDQLEPRDPCYQAIYKLYRKLWEQQGVGVEIDTAPFVCHPDPDVCRVVARMVDLEPHRLSSLWTQKEVHVTTLDDVLAVGVPKSVMLYRTKVVDQMAVDLAVKLASGELNDDETLEVMRSLDRLNAVKQSLAAKSQRLIV